MNSLVSSVLMFLVAPGLLGVAPADSPAQEVRRSGAVDRSRPAVTPEQPSREITLLHSDSRRLVFEYRPRFLPPRTIRDGADSFTEVSFEGSVPLHAANDLGAPDVRYRAIAIAMPAPEGTVVKVIDSESEELRDVACPPVPLMEKGDSLVRSAKYQKDREAYSRGGFFPSQLVEVEYTGRARSLPLGSIKIFPVQYDLTARTARRYTKMIIEVTFGPATLGRVERADVSLFKDAILNSDVALTWSVPGRAKVAAQPVSSVLASGEWYRLTVNEEGIYRLDGQWFPAAGIPVGGVDPRTIKIYGNGGREVPEDVRLPRAEDLVELAIHVEGESDGSFDQGDFVLFYGRSARGWYYDATSRTLRHTINHYTGENYYWLTFGGTQGKRMTERSSASAEPDIAADSFLDGVAIEEEKINLLGSGKDWLGQSISGPSGSFTHVTHLPGLMQGDEITYRYRLVVHSTAVSTYTVREGGTVIGTHSISGVFGYLEGRARVLQVPGTSSLPNNESRLSFAYSSAAAGSQGWIDWIEILYPRMLWGEGDELRFRSPDVSGVVEYRLQQFSSMPWIFDVTEHDSVLRISGVTGSYTFRSAEVAGGVSEYCAAGPPAWRVPAAVQRMPNQDLRGYADGADFIILTTAEFQAAAEKLKAHRERPEYGNLKTVIVDVNKVYNEFGGGLPDITSVRDYLKYVYDHWTPRPAFVLLLGGGSYDYKGILGFPSNRVPTWQSVESLDDVDSYSTDDFFVKFGTSSAISLIVGRISARNSTEAETVVDKIMRYDQNSTQDSWKTRMLFIGDDAWTSDLGNSDGTIHSRDSEILASSIYTPDEFEKKKVYIAEYPTENTAVGRRKPGAYRDIIDQINQGVLVLNYAGHGNPNVLAHERI
ncbi:MAG: C25 family cysteine peptidase, partial [Bacteroidota bacterium]